MKTHPHLSRLLILVGVCLSLSASVAAQVCKCPKFEVVSNLEMVEAGKTVEFEIVSDDPAVLDGKFAWTTSGGKIISGQGTSKIAIETTVDMLPPPPPPPPSGVLVGSHYFRRRTALLNVTVIPKGNDCACSPASGSVRVGLRTVERNRPADVTDLTLNTDLLTLPCEPGRLPARGTTVSPTMVIDVGVTAHDPENDILLYNYTVTGGKIIGSGSNVKWDLSGVAPGTYTITSGVDDGCGLCGKTETNTVTVASCILATNDPVCPEVQISGPNNGVLSTGGNTFTANVTAGTFDPTYEWIVDGGEIASGQGTPVVTVKFGPKSLRSNKSVKVRIGGINPSWGCLVEHSVEYVNGRRKP